jgi:hypothetical protein
MHVDSAKHYNQPGAYLWRGGGGEEEGGLLRNEKYRC